MYDKYRNEISEQERIFNIALSLMDQVGYENLSIRDICKEAKISVGKFYNYFKNKQELLNYFYEQEEKELRKKGANRFDDLPLKDQIIEMYRWHLEYLSSLGVEFVLHYYDSMNEPMAVITKSNYIMDMTDRFLEMAIQNGYKLPEGKLIHDISIDICMISKGVIFTWCAERGSFSLPEVSARLLSECLDGLLPNLPSTR